MQTQLAVPNLFKKVNREVQVRWDSWNYQRVVKENRPDF